MLVRRAIGHLKCLKTLTKNTKCLYFSTTKFKAQFDKNRQIFANSETRLSDIEVYGFDYDYTLISYHSHLKKWIYDQARKTLVEQLKYPNDLLDMEYDPKFAIRGLHYDVRFGLMMKIDAAHRIELGTVYRGLTPVPDEEVLQIYEGVKIPESYLLSKNFPRFIQFVDQFALAELSILANVIHYCNEKRIPYDPEYLHTDVNNAIQSLHKSGTLHNEVMQNLDHYLIPCDRVKQLLDRLSNNRKKIFLISNSSLEFINCGMSIIAGKDWRDLFDCVIVRSRKPSFFANPHRPFRRLDAETSAPLFSAVNRLEKGSVYMSGNVHDMHRFTGWNPNTVLYLGDHVYADLQDASQQLGWRTGAIIPELSLELDVICSREHQDTRQRLAMLEHNLMTGDSTCENLLAQRARQQTYMKSLFNRQFGSVFATTYNFSYFARRLQRYADIYMPSVSDMLTYSDCHTFYPAPQPLPHEHLEWNGNAIFPKKS